MVGFVVELGFEGLDSLRFLFVLGVELLAFCLQLLDDLVAFANFILGGLNFLL